MMRKRGRFDGTFVVLECGHLVWKGSKEFEDWWAVANMFSPQRDRDKAEWVECITCEEVCVKDEPVSEGGLLASLRASE